MAEKFDAILKRMAATSRMKDFYDIFYWSQVFDFDDKPDFSSVLKQIDLFIGPLYDAILSENEFFGTWSAKENVWK